MVGVVGWGGCWVSRGGFCLVLVVVVVVLIVSLGCLIVVFVGSYDGLIFLGVGFWV